MAVDMKHMMVASNGEDLAVIASTYSFPSVLMVVDSAMIAFGSRFSDDC